MIEPRCWPQDFRIRQRQDAEPLRVIKRLLGIDIENVRHIGRMNELKILRDEINIDHASSGILQVPNIVLAFFQRNRAAHLRDIVGDKAGIARSHQDVTNDSLDPRTKIG
ncbi:hypothetical protein NB311A_12649 [Nitrobacter sp. Nb-311A]|nr:hypothetical protein NB311A_12649 [Nitrobacter sp. Nb-311A]